MRETRALLLCLFFCALALAGPDDEVPTRDAFKSKMQTALGATFGHWDSLLRLSPKHQREVQANFDKVYERLRLPGDPATPPTIYLIRSDEAQAFVRPKDNPGVIFVNAAWMLQAESTDILAATIVHELTHFNKDQRARDGWKGGAFANEVDAEIRGIIDRIVRRGQTIDGGDRKGEPADAVFNLETIIKQYESQNFFSSSHPNPRHVAAMLKSVYWDERQRRRFPEADTPKPFSKALEEVIQKAWETTRPMPDKYANVDLSGLRFEPLLSGVASDLKRQPLAALITVHGKLREKLAGLDLGALAAKADKQRLQILDGFGIRTPPTVPIRDFADYVGALELRALKPDDALEAARAPLRQAVDLMAEVGFQVEKLAGHDPVEVYGRIPPGMWSDLLAWQQGLKPFANGAKLNDMYSRERLEAASAIEKYFAAIDRGEAAPFSPELFKIERGRFPFVDRFFIEGMSARADKILGRLKADAFGNLLPIVYTMRFMEERGLAAYHARFLEIMSAAKPGEILAAVEGGKISPHALTYLDKGAGDVHRLTHETRAALLKKFGTHEFREVAAQFVRSDKALADAHAARLAGEGRLKELAETISKENNLFTPKRADALFARAIDGQAREMDAAPFGGDAAARNDLLQRYARAAQGAGGRPLPGEAIIGAAHLPDRVSRLLEALAARGAEGVDLAGIVTSSEEVLTNHIAVGGHLDLMSRRKSRENPLEQMVKDYKERFAIDVTWLKHLGYVAQNTDKPLREGMPLAWAAAAKLIAKNPVMLLRDLVGSNDPQWNARLLAELPWAHAFEKLSPAQFLAVLALDRSPKDVKAFAPVADAIYGRFAQLLEREQLTEGERFLALRSLSQLFPASTGATQRVVDIILKKVAQSKDPTTAFAYLKALHPSLFPSPADYRDAVVKILDREVARHGADLFGVKRKATLEGLMAEVKANVAHVDALTRQGLLDHLAVKTQALPEERAHFSVDRVSIEMSAAGGAEYVNNLLAAYDDLPKHEKWELLQWVRGKSDKLTEGILYHLSLALQKSRVFLPAESVERYVRQRFDSLSPQVRATFFSIALGGKGGLLFETGYRKRIEEELFAGLPGDTRPNVEKLYGAALKALPEPLRDLLLSVGFAESGRHGSPERALTLILASRGALSQKFGQNLAFDANLPASYREALKELWDQIKPPDWWKAYELIERQYGDVRKAGFRLVAIRNAGSTEIVMELEGPDGRRHITAVQREGVRVGAETDHKDLGNLVRELTHTEADRDKFGFMELLVEDSVRTLKLELDPMHKRRMNEQMREAYSRALERRDARGWKFASVHYEEHALADGKTLVTQNVAPGVPFRDLEKTDPRLYRRLSKLVIGLENDVMADPRAPVDKDRMPGQMIVDVKTKTITLLDHGQAQVLTPLARELRDPFVGATLAANAAPLAPLLAKLGVQLKPEHHRALEAGLRATDAGFRPLQALQWLRRNGYVIPPGHEESYFDLIHAVRAKMRLGHWADSLAIGTIHNEWRGLAIANTPFFGTVMGNVPGLAPLIQGCARGYRAFIGIFR